MGLSRSHWLRWLFLSLGGVLIFAHDFVAGTALGANYWSTVIYPGDPRHQVLFLARANFALIPIGCACLLMAWWLKPDRSWIRLAAMTAAIILIFGFPLLMPFAVMSCVSTLAGYRSVTMVAPQPPASAGASR